jgi:hypothetical protein
VKRSIIRNQAQNVELYGLEVDLLSPESLAFYQRIMSAERGGIVNLGHLTQPNLLSL